MPGDLGGVRCGPPSQAAPPEILEAAHDGGKGGGGYYGTAFQGARGLTQGDQLSPTIFIVVVDAVLRNWVTVVIAGAEERGERGKEGRHQAALFYAENGKVALSDPNWIRVHSTPWLACLIGWACRLMLGRQSAWSTAPARRRGISRRGRTGGGSWGRAPHKWSD